MIGRMLPDGERYGEHEANQTIPFGTYKLAALVDTENSVESTSSIVNGCPPSQNAGNSRSSTP